MVEHGEKTGGTILFNKEIAPFVIRVIERNVEEDVEEDEFDEILYYQLEFQAENPVFSPFLKSIQEWGKKNCKKGSKLNSCFGEWLYKQCELPKETHRSPRNRWRPGV